MIERLTKACKAIGPIPKRGYNDHDNYAYVTVDDLANLTRPALAEAGLALVGSIQDVTVTDTATSTGKPAKETRVRCRFRLYSIDDPKREEANGEGYQPLLKPIPAVELYSVGSDVDTQGVNIPNAVAAARKVALLMLLNLGAEAEAQPRRQERRPQGQHQVADPKGPASQAQLSTIQNLLRQKNLETVPVLEKHGVKQLADLKRGQASDIITELTEVRK